MKTCVSVCLFISAIGFATAQANAAVTLSGSPEEVETFVHPEPFVLTLRATAREELPLESIVINGTIEATGKSLEELRSKDKAAQKAIVTALGKQPSATELQFASHFRDFDDNIDLNTIKLLTYRRAFSLKVTDSAYAAEIVATIGSIENVGVNNYLLLFADDQEIKEKLRPQLFESLKAQKAEYEQNLGVTLKLIDFTPFDAAEHGGGGDNEIFELSPFEVSGSSGYRLRNLFKSRREAVELSHMFARRQVTQYIEARYEIVTQ